MTGSLKFNPLRLHTYTLCKETIRLCAEQRQSLTEIFLSRGRMGRMNLMLNLFVSKHKGKMV